MKIVYLFNSLAKMAGTERILTDKMRHLSQTMGHDVHIITYEQGTHPLGFPLPPQVQWTDINVRFFTLYQYGIVKRAVNYLQMRKQFAARLTEQMERLQPDILICTTYSYGELDIIAQLPGNARKILESHVARKTMERRFTSSSNKIQQAVADFHDKRIAKSLHRFSTIVTLTEEDKKSWKEYAHVVVIPNLLTYFPPQGATGEVKKRVMTAGRLLSQKGYELLIQAWTVVQQKHSDWVLDIFGEGEQEAALQQQITANRLSGKARIQQPTAQIYNEYLSSDFYIMSSRWEGFGLVLIEAMACGIPCVSFDCPHGPSDIIRDGEDGLLVENGNIEQLAEKICYLIEHEDIRQEMGRKARENVKRYLPENIMPQWEKLFNDLIRTS